MRFVFDVLFCVCACVCLCCCVVFPLYVFVFVLLFVVLGGCVLYLFFSPCVVAVGVASV